MPLHVRDLGSGPPVVFLHPGPGLDGSVFLPGAQRVADAGYRVLLVDLPGSGRSPAADWTLAGYAEAVKDFVNELGLQDWTLLGHSFGGYVAMQHVVDYATAGRYVASCTDAEEEPAPGVSEDRWDDMPPEIEAAFEREASVATPEECHQVWIDQLPFFGRFMIPERVNGATRVKSSESERQMLDLGLLEPDAALAKLGVTDRGLDPTQVEGRLATFGANELWKITARGRASARR